MSLYSQFEDLRPLPSRELYDQAHTLTEKSFGKDGAWGDVVSQNAALGRVKETRDEFLVTAQYSYLLGNKDLEEIDYEEWAPTALVGRAFAQGFLQQLAPSQLLYSSEYSLRNGLTTLHTSYSSQNFEKKYEDSRDQLHVGGKYILALGQYGLSRLGVKSQAYIDAWAKETYPLSDLLRQAFSLGHGVMVICGMYHQNGMNERLLQIAHEEVDLDQEAIRIFSPGTSEEK